MWTLISRINVKRTRGRLGRVVVTGAIVIGTATEVAMALLPKPVAAAAVPVPMLVPVHAMAPVHFDGAAVTVVETAPAGELPAMASAGSAMVSL